MNQHDQMRQMLEVLKTAYSIIGYPNDDYSELMRKTIEAAEQTLVAEPAPLVRLTDDEIECARLEWCKAGWEVTDFANAIMDAMERVNRRQLDQTPNSPSE